MSTQIFMHTCILLLLSLTAKIAVAFPSLAKPNCKPNCGNVSIPYPFGIGNGCYLDRWYEISCNESSNPPTIFLPRIQLEVLDITLEDFSSTKTHVRVKSPIISENCSGRKISKIVNITGSPFFFDDSYNTFVAAGCDARALLVGTEPAIIGCQSDCRGNGYFVLTRPCNGDSCCKASIPRGLQLFNATFERKTESCKLAFIVESEWFGITDNITEVQSIEYVQALLGWGIANLGSLELPNQLRPKEYTCYSYSDQYSEPQVAKCNCLAGYEGNPYLPNGCQDECKNPKRRRSYECQKQTIFTILGLSLGSVVLLLLFIVAWWMYKILKRKRKIKLRKKLFRRILRQQMFSSQDGIPKTMLYDLRELDKATDHFNQNRILGKGGQGTVYKGMLVDGQIVAIKKSIAINDNKVEEFINEVLILSQINHRNVVKLLGCCLETEVPLLVYEYISNGTLFQYLHDQMEEIHLTWKMRLRIAIESAEAISYLHSSASTPIFHRDIKSTNILLDERYRAKVSDFGTSRSIAIDQTHLTTNVHGTFGYLDPEYFHSSQFTEKSDVYSFGVVLVELITGEKPILIISIEEARSLASHFMLLMQENQLFEVVDDQIIQDCVHEEILAVAKLAYRCLNSTGKKRPNMKEVADELKRIQSLQKVSNPQQACEEDEYYKPNHFSYTWDSTSTSLGFNSTKTTSSLDLQPFI